MAPREYIRFFLSFFIIGTCFAQEPKPEVKAPATDKVSDYLLQPSDLLQVKVFQEEDLTREVRISQEHTINLPLVGSIDLKGKTLRQAEELVTALYNKDFLVSPQVTLVVTQYAKRTVDVQGQVGSPGAIEFPQEKGLSLLQAITRAGGFTRLADKKRLMLTRRSPDGTAKTFIINATEIIDGTSQESWELLKDDSIFVPERII